MFYDRTVFQTSLGASIVRTLKFDRLVSWKQTTSTGKAITASTCKQYPTKGDSNKKNDLAWHALTAKINIRFSALLKQPVQLKQSTVYSKFGTLKSETRTALIKWRNGRADRRAEEVQALFKESELLYGTKNGLEILSNIACRSIFNYPKEWVFEVFVPRFSFFFTDKNPVVRKLEVPGPHLQKAIHDENFRVRKLCCDVFVDVAKNSSGRVKTEMLTPLFLHLLKDSHKTVYHSAIRQLGAFIATFADPNKTGIEFKDGRLIQLDNLSPDEDEVEEDEEDTDLRIPNRPNGKLSSFDSTHDLTAMLVNGHTTPNAAYSLSNESASDKQRPEVAESNSLEDKYNMPKGFVMPAENISSKESQQKQYEEDSLDASFLDNEENEDKSTINDTAAANVTLYSMLLAEKFNKPSPNHEKEDVGQQNNVFESYTKFSLECPSKEEEMDEQNVDEVKNFRKKRDSSPIEWDNNTCSAAELRMERPHLWLMKKEMRRIMNEKKNKEQQKLSARDTTQDLSDSSEVCITEYFQIPIAAKNCRSESLLPRNNSNLSTAATTGSDTDLEHFETSSSQAVPSSDESASHTTYWSFKNMLEMQVNDLESYNSRRTHQLRLRESGADEKKQEKEESAAENGGEINSSNSSTQTLGIRRPMPKLVQFKHLNFCNAIWISSYCRSVWIFSHRSVQSVVHNGSALAAALPVSLRRLTVSESSDPVLLMLSTQLHFANLIC
uniref:Uncharacterized protein n=1 Tax=Ditylenchus dipsaci TaxID=166011 RepID=A0A915E6R7_9BILA